MKPPFRLLLLFASLLPLSLLSAQTVVYTGDHLPTASVVEGSNPATNANLYTTVLFTNTSWVAQDGFLKMTTAPIRGLWFGSTGGYGDPSVPDSSRPSTGADGNSLRMTSLLTPNSTAWNMQLSDNKSIGYLTFEETELSMGMPGVWGRFESGMVKLSDALFNINVLHTYEIHIFDQTVSYRIDGEEIARGPAAQSPTPRTYFIGDITGSTPTGTGSMWIDYVEFDNAAGPLPIPEPGTAGLVLGLAAALGLLIRRQRGR